MLLISSFLIFVRRRHEYTPSTQCIIGSCNFTTLRKANLESGAFLRSTFEKEWIHKFEACYSSGEGIDEFGTRVACFHTVLRSAARNGREGSPADLRIAAVQRRTYMH